MVFAAISQSAQPFKFLAVSSHSNLLRSRRSNSSLTFLSWSCACWYPVSEIRRINSSFLELYSCFFCSSSASFCLLCRKSSLWNCTLSWSSCIFCCFAKNENFSAKYWYFKTSSFCCCTFTNDSWISLRLSTSLRISIIFCCILPYWITLSCISSIWISCSIQIYSFTNSSIRLFILKGMARLNNMGNFSISSPPRYSSYNFLRKVSLREVANQAPLSYLRFRYSRISSADMTLCSMR